MLEKIADKGVKVFIGGVVLAAGLTAGWVTDHIRLKKQNKNLETRLVAVEERLNEAEIEAGIEAGIATEENTKVEKKQGKKERIVEFKDNKKDEQQN